MSKLASAALLVCLAGCASLGTQSKQSPPLAPPISFPQAQRTTQTVVIDRDGQTHRTLCVLELGPRGLVLVAFTELGQRLFTIEYGPDKFAIDTSPVLPPQFEASLVLADLQLVYWPLDVLRNSLHDSWSVTESPSNAERRLMHEGNVVAEARHDADGSIDIRRASLGYHMTIVAVTD
jgi:hypothetical protein